MTSKSLRRLLRSGYSFFISSENTHKDGSTAAAPKLVCTGQARIAMHLSERACSSHFSCLPLSGACQYQSSSFSSTSLSYSSANYTEDDLRAYVDNAPDDLEQLERSQSCSTLQGRRQFMPSLKTLLHVGGAGSLHTVLTYRAKSCAKLQNTDKELPSYRPTRSWSSSSLPTPQHTIELPRRASSSHSSPDYSRSRGRCAPRGHVAVYVEDDTQRHVVPIAYLGHTLFQGLLERAQREYGYRQEGPGLRIPCNLSELRQTLHRICIE